MRRASARIIAFSVQFTKSDGTFYADAHGATNFGMAIDPSADGSYKVNLYKLDLEYVLKD